MDFYLDHQGMEGDMPSAEPATRARSARGGLESQTASQQPKPATSRHSRSDLIQIIEGEIIPRLFLAHRDRAPHSLVGTGCAAGEMGDSAFLARLLVDGDATDIVNRLQDLLGAGMRRDRLYLEVLAPVPATLSRLWADGQFSFDEIALGLCCLDEVLQQMHEREDAPPEPH